MARNLNIVGICGSLRTASYSRAVLRSIAELLPSDTNFVELDPGAFPHYNHDIDGATTPGPVREGRAVIAASDAVLIVSPEFNYGLPGVLKNMLDWLSRPVYTSCLGGKPVFFATISPGALGGVRAQSHLRETLSSMVCKLMPLPEVAITHVAGKLDNDRLADKGTIEYIQTVINSFLQQAGLRHRAS